MILRTRNLFLAWLAYGALQLALLGLPGAAAEPGVGIRGARTQTESHTVTFGKRLVAPDLIGRRTPTTPFAPSLHVRLDLPTRVGREAVVGQDRQADAGDPIVLPLSRAPPALS